MNKAIDQITEQIDLFNILTKLNDLEKLKEVIFSQQQLLMFNFAPKPLISLDNTKEVFNRTVVEERTRRLSLISGMIPPKSWNPQIKYTTISKQMRRCMQRFILLMMMYCKRQRMIKTSLFVVI